MTDDNHEQHIAKLLDAVLSRNTASVAKVLRSTTINVNEFYHGLNALTLAAWNDDVPMMRYLVEKARADANAVGDLETILMHAIQYGNLGPVRYLVEEAKVDVNYRPAIDYCALDYAVANGNLSIVRCLLESGNATFTIFGNAPTSYTLPRRIKPRRWQLVRYLSRYPRGYGIRAFVMGDGTKFHRPTLALFTHRLYDRRIIGVVWSFIA